MLRYVWFFVSSWTVAQAPLSIEFSRQEYWSELPFATPGDLSHPGIEPWVSYIGRQILNHFVTWEAQALCRLS